MKLMNFLQGHAFGSETDLVPDNIAMSDLKHKNG